MQEADGAGAQEAKGGDAGDVGPARRGGVEVKWKPEGSRVAEKAPERERRTGVGVQERVRWEGWGVGERVGVGGLEGLRVVEAG